VEVVPEEGIPVEVCPVPVPVPRRAHEDPDIVSPLNLDEGLVASLSMNRRSGEKFFPCFMLF